MKDKLYFFCCGILVGSLMAIIVYFLVQPQTDTDKQDVLDMIEERAIKLEEHNAEVKDVIQTIDDFLSIHDIRPLL